MGVLPSPPGPPLGQRCVSPGRCFASSPAGCAARHIPPAFPGISSPATTSPGTAAEVSQPRAVGAEKTPSRLFPPRLGGWQGEDRGHSRTPLQGSPRTGGPASHHRERGTCPASLGFGHAWLRAIKGRLLSGFRRVSCVHRAVGIAVSPAGCYRHPRGPYSSCPGWDPRACSSTPVHTQLCTATLTAILCVLQAQPWESLGTSKLLKAHGDCTAPETRPARRDGQMGHASTLPARAPPRALSLGTGSCTLWADLPLFPTAQLCKGGLAPGGGTLQCRTLLLAGSMAARGASSGAEALQRRRVAGGCLQQLPWL